MKIVLAYIVVTGGPKSADYCARFVSTYHEHGPGIEHSTLVICNGGPLPYETALIFAPLNAVFFPRMNDEGWDVSAYLAAAHGPAKDADMLVCLGESVYFHREGWLRRFAEAWQKHGQGMYSALASYLLRPHLGTTAFATSPELLWRWQGKVNDRRSRYLFEHGPQAFWHMVEKRWDRPAMLVTWVGEYTWQHWRQPPNGLFKGDQSDCLVACNHTDRYRDASEDTKRRWTHGADILRVWA